MTDDAKTGEPSSSSTTAAAAPAPPDDTTDSLATTLPQATSIEPQVTEASLSADAAPTEGPLASAQQINPVIAAQVRLPKRQAFAPTHDRSFTHFKQ
jgi:hypothetical protein